MPRGRLRAVPSRLCLIAGHSRVRPCSGFLKAFPKRASPMLFWILVVLLVSACLLAVVAPLWRRARPELGDVAEEGGGVVRASHDLQVFRDQLREVEADARRGLLSPEEAAATRTEVSRRLLAAADAEAAAAEPQPAPARVTRLAVAGVLIGAGLMAVGLYARLGAPDLPDSPRVERMAAAATAYAARPGQDAAEAEAKRGGAPLAPTDEELLVDRLAKVVAARPEDVEGHRLLARSLAGLGRFADARRAQAKVVTLKGPQATGEDFVTLAELMIRAVNGYVSPEAEVALAEGLRRDPGNGLGRYLSGVALLQAGRPDLAYPIWDRLLAEGPADAPWMAPIRETIDGVANLAGLPPRTPARGPEVQAGPDASDVAGAAAMDPAGRAAMIGGMVDRLAARLAAEGGPPQDWARLVHALRVLGRDTDASDVAGEASRAFAADAAARAMIEAAATGPLPVPEGAPAPAAAP